MDLRVPQTSEAGSEPQSEVLRPSRYLMVLGGGFAGHFALFGLGSVKQAEPNPSRGSRLGSEDVLFSNENPTVGFPDVFGRSLSQQTCQNLHDF